MAKPSGTPNSLIVTWLAVGARALRASRSAHERREWARCARERITSALRGEAAARGGMLTSIRWCRTSCIQARRCALRLQSREAAAARGQPGEDAAGDFPDAALWLLPRAIDTADALGSRDNRVSWRCRARADCHRLPGAAPLGATSCHLDSAAPRRVGGRSPAPRNDPRSCARQPKACHSLAQALVPLWSLWWGEQTRSCASESAQAHDPVPGVGSRPTAR